MPERQDLQVIACDSVVDEVADAAQIEPTDIRRASAQMPGTDARLLSEEGDCLGEVGRDSPRSRGAIVRPPLRRGSNLVCCSRAILTRSATVSP